MVQLYINAHKVFYMYAFHKNIIIADTSFFQLALQLVTIGISHKNSRSVIEETNRALWSSTCEEYSRHHLSQSWLFSTKTVLMIHVPYI